MSNETMTKWEIIPPKHGATEIREYSKDGNRVKITYVLKWSSFICTKDGDGIPDVNMHDVWQTPGEIEEGNYDSHGADVDLDDCDEETRRWLEELEEEDLPYALEEHGWDLVVDRTELHDFRLTCLEGAKAGRSYTSSGRDITDSSDEDSEYDEDEDSEFDEDEDSEFDNSLLEAAIDGDVEQIKSLLANGANVHAKDTEDINALMNAAASDSDAAAEVVKLLLDAGANVHAKDCGDSTALIWAAESDNDAAAEVVKLLLDAGADVNAKNHEGKTALDIAIRDGNEDVANLLREAGAKRGGDD